MPVFLSIGRISKGVEKDPPGKGLLSDRSRFFGGNSHREEGHQFVFPGNIQDLCHPVADPVGIGDMAFIPAAGVAQIGDGQQQILYGGGIILDISQNLTISLSQPSRPRG